MPGSRDSDGICGDSLIIKPPFTITEAEMRELFDKLSKALDAVKW